MYILILPLYKLVGKTDTPLLSSHQVLVFSEKKAEVDDIHEYLLLKGVEAVSTHGGKGSYASCRGRNLVPRLIPPGTPIPPFHNVLSHYLQ